MTRFLILLGTPSIPLLALLLDLLTRRRLFSQGERRALLSFVAAAAIVLYSSTLGYVPLDVYRAGFSTWAPLLLAAIALAIAPRSLPLAGVALATLVAYDVPLFTSVNLFDYAVDPILGLAAVGWAVMAIARRLLAPLPARGERVARSAG